MLSKSLIQFSVDGLYMLEINPFSISSFANIFSHCEVCLCLLFMASFAMQNF